MSGDAPNTTTNDYWTPERVAEFDEAKAAPAKIKGPLKIRMPADYVPKDTGRER